MKFLFAAIILAFAAFTSGAPTVSPVCNKTVQTLFNSATSQKCLNALSKVNNANTTSQMTQSLSLLCSASTLNSCNADYRSLAATLAKACPQEIHQASTNNIQSLYADLLVLQTTTKVCKYMVAFLEVYSAPIPRF